MDGWIGGRMILNQQVPLGKSTLMGEQRTFSVPDLK